MTRSASSRYDGYYTWKAVARHVPSGTGRYHTYNMAASKAGEINRENNDQTRDVTAMKWHGARVKR